MSWSKIPAAAEHYGVSPRTIRTLIKEDDFPHSRLPSGTILIELETGDQWLRERSNEKDSERLINEIMESIG